MEGHVPHKAGEYTWTEEKCLELIRKFRAQTILWNTKNPLFYKQNIKRKVWDTLGTELNTSGAECKHKMSILLSSFRREKSKLRNNLARGHGSPFQSTWFAFNDLSFLLQRDSHENTLENYDDSGAEAASSVNESDLNLRTDETYFLPEENSNDLNLKTEPLSDDDEELERDLGIVTTMIKSATNNKIVVEPLRNETPESTQQITTNEQSLPRKMAVKHNDSYMHEEIATFTAFIAAKMRKYSSETLHAVEKEIFDILFKADLNFYDNNYTSSDDGQSNSKKRKLTADS